MLLLLLSYLPLVQNGWDRLWVMGFGCRQGVGWAGYRTVRLSLLAVKLNYTVFEEISCVFFFKKSRTAPSKTVSF